VGDIVDVWVCGVDLERDRVSLSMVPVSPEEGDD
jgi:protein Tex